MKGLPDKQSHGLIMNESHCIFFLKTKFGRFWLKERRHSENKKKNVLGKKKPKEKLATGPSGE